MPWIRVANYSLGFNTLKKQFYFYYTLEGAGAVTQLFLTPPQFTALSDMFRNEGPIDFNTDGSYFATVQELVGEQEAHP